MDVDPSEIWAQGEAEIATAFARLETLSPNGFPALTAARQRTHSGLQAHRERLAALQHHQDASIVLMGSWGRHEVTSGSDDDYLILVNGLDRTDVKPSLQDLSGLIGSGDNKPGAQGIFESVVFCDPMVTNIGLNEDTNQNLTRRMLMLFESQPVTGTPAYDAALSKIIGAYLGDTPKSFRPPRFLLNDLMRYWRTICVDFAGKEREDQSKWALRNAKLRLNRKVLYAGGLVPILLCHTKNGEEQQQFLLDQLTKPPIDRLASAFLYLGIPDAGLRTMRAYDSWIAMLDDQDTRSHLASLDADSSKEDATFAQVRRLATDLENGLLALLFETRLATVLREFGIF